MEKLRVINVVQELKLEAQRRGAITVNMFKEDSGGSGPCRMGGSDYGEMAMTFKVTLISGLEYGS